MGGARLRVGWAPGALEVRGALRGAGASGLGRLGLRTTVSGQAWPLAAVTPFPAPTMAAPGPGAHLGGGLLPQQVAKWAQCRDVLPSRGSVEGGRCLGQMASPVMLHDGQSAAWAPLMGTPPFLSSQDPGTNPGSPSPQRPAPGGG